MIFGIWHKHHSWYFKIVSNFTRLTACEIACNNFEISLVVFMPNITTNHAITYSNSLVTIILITHTYPNTGKCAEKKDRLPLARDVSFPPSKHHGRIYIVHHPSSLFQCEKTYMETSIRQVKESFWENYFWGMNLAPNHNVRKLWSFKAK